jgi:hypothetical protein
MLRKHANPLMLHTAMPVPADAGLNLDVKG